MLNSCASGCGTHLIQAEHMASQITLFSEEHRDIQREISRFLCGRDLVSFSGISRSCSKLCDMTFYQERIKLELADSTLCARLRSYNFDDYPPLWKKEYLRICRTIVGHCGLCDKECPIFPSTTGRFHHLKVTAMKFH